MTKLQILEMKRLEILECIKLANQQGEETYRSELVEELKEVQQQLKELREENATKSPCVHCCSGSCVNCQRYENK